MLLDVSGKVLTEYVERWKGITTMNIIIPYEKYINYNLLSLKKRTCKKQYETGHSKQLFLSFI